MDDVRQRRNGNASAQQAGISAPRMAAGGTAEVACLLVEDNVGDAMLTVHALDRAEGLRCRVIVVETVALAVAFLRTARPDVLLLDLGLPDAQGVEAVCALRSAVPDVPIVVLTGTDDLPTVHVVLEQGADDYLVKGDVQPAEIVRSIRYAISRRVALRELFVSEERYRTLFVDNAVAMQCTGPDGTVVDVNPAFAALAGGPAGAFVGCHIEEATHPDDRSAEQRALKPLFDGVANAASYAKRLRRADGTTSSVFVRATAVRDAAGDLAFVTAVLEDVAALHRQHADAAFRALVLECITQAVVVTDRAGTVLYGNDAAQELLGLPAEAAGLSLQDAVGRDIPEAAFSELVDGGGWSGELPPRPGSAPVWLTVSPVEDDRTGFRGWVLVGSDISDQRRAEEQLAYQAMHDPLTGLPNRALFMDRLEQAVQRGRRSGQGMAVICLGLDNFKLINDSFSPSAGDEVLRSAAALLSAVMRPGDTVARLGGDEFGVVCERVSSPADARVMADRLRAALSAPFGVRDRKVHLTASAGVAHSPGDMATADSLFQDADVALDAAKTRGRDRTEGSDAGRRAEVARRLEIREALQNALVLGEFQLHYQPIVHVGTNRISAFEALIRWASPTLGRVMPSEFVPVLEEGDLIIPVGRWVVRQATQDLAAWRGLYPDMDLGVTVNLSSRQLSDAELVDVVSEAVRTTGIPPGRLCLELTETAMVDDAATAATMLRELKACGVKLAVDDFGTGYSSLAYLKRFPIDYVKIDRAFVRGLGTDPDDTVIVASVIDLAERLGLEVVAEGVEDERQRHELLELGCRWGQGFLWSRPQPALLIDELLGAGAAPAPALAANESRMAPAARRRDDDDVVAVVTHGLRAPVAVIQGFAETIHSIVGDGENDALRAAADAITRQTAALTRLAEALADARALDAGTMTMSFVRFDAAGAVAHIVAEADLGTSPPNVALDVRATGTVIADEKRFCQLVVTLLQNAVAHSPAGAPVGVVVDVENGEVVVRVIDRGAGVPPDRVGELFRKFTQISSAGKGVGLGLYVARGLARAHGGDIAYRRASTGGAEFALRLPSADRRLVSTEPVPPGHVAVEVYVRPTGGRLRPAFSNPSIRRDAEVLAVTHAATRALFDAVCAEQVVGIAIDLVVDLGGRVVPTCTDQDSLALDLSFGDDGLFPAAEPMSVARRRLEEVLPSFIRDAARRTAVLVAQPPEDRGDHYDVVTGLLSRRQFFTEAAASATAGSVALFRLEDAAGLSRAERTNAVKALSRLLRTCSAPGETLVRWSTGELVVVVPQRSVDELARHAADVEALWPAWAPGPAGISVGAGDLSAGVRQAIAQARGASARAGLVSTLHGEGERPND